MQSWFQRRNAVFALFFSDVGMRTEEAYKGPFLRHKMIKKYYKIINIYILTIADGVIYFESQSI